MEEKPNYYAVIPAEVRYDNTLKDKAKILYGEISSLCNRKGYCYASNKYFADLYGLSISTISRLINNLNKRGYIKNLITYKNNSKEIDKRYLQICNEGYRQFCGEGIGKKVKENNTSINNKENINNKLFIQKKKFIKPTLEELENYCKEKKYDVDYEKFFNYYESIGWLVGKARTPMKSWVHALNNWKKNEDLYLKNKPKNYSDTFSTEGKRFFN